MRKPNMTYGVADQFASSKKFLTEMFFTSNQMRKIEFWFLKKNCGLWDIFSPADSGEFS